MWTTATVSNVSFYIDNPFFNGTVSEFGTNGNLIFSEALPITTYGSSGVVVSLPGTGVHDLQIQGVADFFVIDDLSYNAGGGVPEPASLALFGSGILGIASVVRRKMKR
jgi:hypothetical protein